MKFEEIIRKRFEELEHSLDALIKKGKPGTTQQIFPILDCRQWCTSVLSLLERITSQDSIHYKTFLAAQPAADASIMIEDRLSNCVGVFRAAKEDYLGGYLFSLRALVEAEVLSDGLEQAEEFLKSGYKDAACIVTGVVLETVLRELCSRRSLPIGKLDSMNSELAKTGIYNKSMQKQITAWAGFRNDGAHGNWQGYTKEQIEQMIAGVNGFIATYLN